MGFFMTLSFSSCFIGEEKIEIKDNDAGSYTMNIDMSEMISMAKQMGQSEKMQEGIESKKDTVIYFKSYVDTSKLLTAKEKEMLKDGWLHFMVDMPNDKFQMIMKADFSKLEDIDYVRQNFNKTIQKLGVMDALDKKKDKKEKEPEEESPIGDKNDNNPIAKGYVFSAAPGKISYKVTDTKILDDVMQSDSVVMAMRMLAQMTENSAMKYSYTLPRPVKNYKGNNAVLSADKKTISFSTPLKDLLDDPKLLEYEIEY